MSHADAAGLWREYFGRRKSQCANHKAFQLVDLRLFKYSPLLGLAQIATLVWAGRMLRAALFEFNRRPGFKTHPAGQGHNPNGRPAAKAPLAPEDLKEEVGQT